MVDSGDGLLSLLVGFHDVHVVFHFGFVDTMIDVVLACKSEHV